MPRPVDVLIGDMNNPVVWRAPIVIIRIAAAESIRIHTLCLEASVVLFKSKLPK